MSLRLSATDVLGESEATQGAMHCRFWSFHWFLFFSMDNNKNLGYFQLFSFLSEARGLSSDWLTFMTE